MSLNQIAQTHAQGDYRHAAEERIGGVYILKEPLGSGGFAEVWRALDTSAKRQVALKIFYEDIMVWLYLAKGVLREAETQARIRSERVIAIHSCHLDFNAGPGPYYIAMHLMTGGTLDDLLERETRLPFARAVSIIRDVAEGLEAAHKAEIVHRDIKPNNVLFDENGRAALADFGIAKDLRAKGRNRSVFGKPGVGTPHYMSPEQHMGTDVTKSWDIYSAGVLLYEMLTGETPFVGPSDTAIYKAKTEQPVPLLRSKCPEIPARLQLVVERCLDPNLNFRYRDCDELLRALDWALDDSEPTKLIRKSGDRVAAFELMSLLSSGATSEVWQALETVERQLVALKVFDASNNSKVPAIRGAVESQARLSNDNIVRVYEKRLDGVAPFYISMQFMSGGSLKTLLENRKTLRLPEALLIVGKILNGLRTAHAAGVIHGNITTANVLFGANETVALSDFGAHVRTGEVSPAEISYWSPEQCLGNPPSKSSDIYSVGAILLHILVGHLPFSGNTVRELIDAKLEQARLQRLPPLAGDRSLPERLEKVILCCLDTNLDYRYADCESLTRALDWAMEAKQSAEPVTASEPPFSVPTPPTPTVVSKDGTQALFVIIGLIALVIAVSVCVSIWGGH